MTTRRKYIFIGITALLLGIAVIFFVAKPDPERKIFLQVVPIHTAGGWGYNILANGKIYIHQEYMPGIPGTQGFKTSADAERVGGLVIKRISSNQMPMISRRDLDSLGVLEK